MEIVSHWTMDFVVAISRKWKRGLSSDRTVLLFDILFRFSLVSVASKMG